MRKCRSRKWPRLSTLAVPRSSRAKATAYVGYVIFDKKEDYAEVEVVEACREFLKRKMESGELVLPAGIEEPTFVGSYENQLRSAKTLALLVPLALFSIFIILYMHFKSTSNSLVVSISTTLLVLIGVLVAASGGMILLWLYSTSWFADVAIFNVNMRELFRIHPINLSVAVWVGFIALMGIATDDGVVVASYLGESFRRQQPSTIAEIREATVQAGLRRLRPCLMTTATTILALIPVLTSRGRGSDVMVPMAIPSFGGMLIELMTLFVVPVSYCLIQELRLKMRPAESTPPAPEETGIEKDEG